MENADKIIGIEADPFEDLDRKIQIAIAKAASAKFSAQGDEMAARAEVHRLMNERSRLELGGLAAAS